MRIANTVLSLSGSGVLPDSRDAIIDVPNQLIPTFSPRGPMTAFITSSPSTSIGESHCAYGTQQQPASTAGFDTTLTQVTAGLWQFEIQYGGIVSPAFTVADNANSQCGYIALRRADPLGGAAIQVILLPTAISTVINYRFGVTFNFSQDGWQIRYRTPTTIAGQTCAVVASVIASRLS